MPTTNFLINGVDVGSYFGAKGASTAGATNFKRNGTDLNAILLALADGTNIGFNTNMKVNSNDLRNVFGQPIGNTPLPINGNTYTSGYNIPSASTGFATVGFRIVTGNTWQVWEANPTNGNIVVASGAVPSGAATVKFTFGTYSVLVGDIDAGGSVTNGASSATAISSNPTCNYTTSTAGSSSGSRSRSYPFTIDFYNASSVDISTTNITLVGQTDGST